MDIDVLYYYKNNILLYHSDQAKYVRINKLLTNFKIIHVSVKKQYQIVKASN